MYIVTCPHSFTLLFLAVLVMLSKVLLCCMLMVCLCWWPWRP
uniref:Uncharacterized protein n=1 Tax=Arundo donax TaxID=35708 RepID=A0A0A9F0Y4_ARUDO